MSRRRAFLERTHRARERARRPAGPDPAAMIRLAGLGAAAVLALAVFVGFTDAGREAGWLGPLARVEGLTRPVLLGLSVLEMVLILAVAAFAALILLRARSRGETRDGGGDVAADPPGRPAPDTDSSSGDGGGDGGGGGD